MTIVDYFGIGATVLLLILMIAEVLFDANR